MDDFGELKVDNFGLVHETTRFGKTRVLAQNLRPQGAETQ
jgi:hypothetical protein